MRIIIKKAGCVPEIKKIKGTLENLKEIVGGYIECFPVFDNVLCVCNEDGKALGLPPNFKFCNDVIVGDVFFCAGAEEEFVGLTDEQIAIIMTVFKARM